MLWLPILEFNNHCKELTPKNPVRTIPNKGKPASTQALNLKDEIAIDLSDQSVESDGISLVNAGQ